MAAVTADGAQPADLTEAGLPAGRGAKTLGALLDVLAGVEDAASYSRALDHDLRAMCDAIAYVGPERDRATGGPRRLPAIHVQSGVVSSSPVCPSAYSASPSREDWGVEESSAERCGGGSFPFRVAGSESSG